MKKILVLISLVLLSLTLVGCGFSGGDQISIESVKTRDVDEGVEVTITYVDDLADPFSFVVPKGADGKGIKDATYELDEENNKTILTLYFENDELGVGGAYKVDIPNGRYVVSASSAINENDGNTVIKLKFSDGTESQDIIVKKGDTGENGLSIVDVQSKLSSDFNSVEFTFLFAKDPSVDPTAEDFKPDYTKKITVPILQGVSVEEIESVYDPDTYKYGIKIRLSNQDEGTVYDFDRMNIIIVDKGIPTEEQGIDGDVYFSTSSKIMYRKVSGMWWEWYSFNTNVTSYQVTLNLNDSPEAPATIDGNIEFTIKEGRYFVSENYVLNEPTRPGYKFVGWYTVLNPNFKTSQPFTDMTPVYSKMDLFAIWEEE